MVLNNLSSGQQKIKVFHFDGEQYNLVGNFNFSVENPWYLSFWMILIYLLVLVILFYIYYKWNKIGYHEKLKLKEEELKRQKEIIQIELEAEKKELELLIYE